MKPKTILGLIALLVVVLLAGMFVWARSVLTGDAVRTTVAQQLSEALGEPVTIGGIGASVLPRVSMNLTDVTIGEPARVTVARLNVGTALGALLSRRIEHADLVLEGARVVLPLSFDALGGPAEPATTAEHAPAVELVSVDQIRLSDVELVSGDRTVRGDAELVWDRGTVTISRADIGLGDATLRITGQITDVAAPVGELQISAGDLGLLELVEFFSEFTAGAAADSSMADGAPHPADVASSPSVMNLALEIVAEEARLGTMALTGLTGRASVTPGGVSLEPVGFGVFGGSAEGRLTFTLAETPAFELAATVMDIDVAVAMAFSGSPDSLSGRATGRLDLTGRGVTASEAIQSARGTARLDVVDGAVQGLGLVRTLVLATSMRADSRAEVVTTRPDGSFTRLGLTAEIDGGVAQTTDLIFESPDVLMGAAGSIRLATTAVDLAAEVQLSEALSSSAGRDLVRYTQQDGRVTLPATVTGPVDALAVRLDAVDATRRAITNRAAEEARKALGKALGRIIRRR